MKIVMTGVNRGVGAALYAAYSEAGHDVLGTARDGAADVTLDVTDPGAFEPFAATVEGHVGSGGLDLLVCNAGVYIDKGQPLDGGYPADMWAQTFAVNVTGVFLTIQSLLPSLRRADAGRIAIVSSVMASQENAPGGSYVYRSSKAAVLNLGRNLARDLVADGISVGIYHPGWVRTDMGGPQAAVSPQESAQGLMIRFEALGPGTTGCFEAWDGASIPL